MIKKAISVSLLILSASIKSNAQFFIGGGAAVNSYAKGVGLFPALQPRLGVDYKEGRASILAGFNFSPLAQKNKFNAVYTSSDGTGKTSVLYSESLSINNAFLHIAYRLGSMENKLRFKFIFGASNDFMRLKYKANRKVPAGYKSDYTVEDASLSGPKVDIGFGADFRSSPKDDIYFEVIAGLPANQVNGQYIYNPAALHLGFTIGYSHYFGKRDYTGEY